MAKAPDYPSLVADAEKAVQSVKDPELTDEQAARLRAAKLRAARQFAPGLRYALP